METLVHSHESAPHPFMWPSSLPSPIDASVLDELWYEPDAVFFDQIESIDRASSTLVCRMPTLASLPLTCAQRVHPSRHPQHVNGGLIVHATGILGLVHALLFHGVRRSAGWTGYGTHINKASFRRLSTIGSPLMCTCVEQRARRWGSRLFCTYAFEFHQDGELAYESQQSALWMRQVDGAPD